MARQSFIWVVLGALAGAGIGFAIAWALAGDDVYQVGDWRAGGARFIGLVTAIGLVSGSMIAKFVTRGPAMTRDGFTLSYRRIEPTASGYREITTVTVDDLLAALRAVGYEPAVTACDDVGTPRGSIDPKTPLAGANFAITDPKVRGRIRVQLAPPPEGQARAMGLVEMWSLRGDTTEELALFTLRALGGLVGGLAGSRETSVLSEDPVAILTAGLADRPVHRG